MYGLDKFNLFYSIYPCMLHVSYLSTCTFLHTQILNLAPRLFSMVHKFSKNYYCAPNGPLSKGLFPLEVIWCQNFTLTILVVTFSYKLCFVNILARWKVLLELFDLIWRKKIYLVLMGFQWLQTSFKASKYPRKLMTFKNMKNSKIFI
jgi:hypothetical protein